MAAISADLDWLCATFQAQFSSPADYAAGWRPMVDPLGILPCSARFIGPGASYNVAKYAPPVSNFAAHPQTPYVYQSFVPDTHPTCGQLTDSIILTMEPGELLETYYTLAMMAECDRFEGQPKWCSINPFTAYWWQRVPQEDPTYRAAIEAKYRRHIYDLRADLHVIETPDGPVKGLIELPTHIIRPTCKPSTWWEIGQWIGTAVGALVPASWPMTIANLAATAAVTYSEISDRLKAAREQRELIDRVLKGARAIGGQSLLDSLVRSGQLTDRLLWEEAVLLPVTIRGWELALVIGLPHPAMICKRLAPTCTPLEIETLLAGAITLAHRRHRIELQARMESELQLHPAHFLLEAGRLPDAESALGGPVGSYLRPNGQPMTGLFPVLVERDGVLYFVTAATQTEAQRLIAVNQVPDVPATKEWLRWRNHPDILPSEIVPTIAWLIADAGKPAERAALSASAPATVFGGRFTELTPSNAIDRMISAPGSTVTGNGTAHDGARITPSEAGIASIGMAGAMPFLLLGGVALWFALKGK